MLKTRSMSPPGGWRFNQPEMGWKLKPGHHFKSAVSEIIKCRLNNPRFNLTTDRTAVENELDNYTCALLKNDPGWCIGPEAPSFQRPPLVKQHPVGGKGSAAVGGISRFFSNASAGIKTWITWYGDGKTVDKEKAEQRASICVTCPKNEKANIAERFTSAAAKEIFSIFTSLKDLNLHTSKDSELHVCSACECPLVAKLWAPINVIKKHITPEAWDALDKRCWMLSEVE